MHLLALDATFVRFELRYDWLLAQHRDLLALDVQAVPPMRDGNSSNRGLGPRVACGTNVLRRLDEALMNFVGDVLNSSSTETKIRLFRVLAVCALKNTFVTFLHLDRQRRHLMNYANNFSELTLNEQKSVALFLVNLFSDPQTQSWVLYFSEWSQGIIKFLYIVVLIFHCII